MATFTNIQVNVCLRWIHEQNTYHNRFHEQECVPRPWSMFCNVLMLIEWLLRYMTMRFHLQTLAYVMPNEMGRWPWMMRRQGFERRQSWVTWSYHPSTCLYKLWKTRNTKVVITGDRNSNQMRPEYTSVELQVQRFVRIISMTGRNKADEIGRWLV